MKKVIMIAVVLIMLFSLVACDQPETNKIEVGFEGGRGATGEFGDFFCGAKSDTIVFDVDNVQIDFYFGWASYSFSNSTRDWTVLDGYERVGIAAYFYGYGDNGSEYMTRKEYSDYRNIENAYLIKEFSAEEFFTEDYAALYTTSGLLGRKGNTAFNHYEHFQVPREIFHRESGIFYFGLFDVIHSKADDKYRFGSNQVLHDDVKLIYENIVNNQVKIVSVY